MGDKQDIRERVWRTLEEEGAARFPGARGRIPNFRGAEAAAERLAATQVWKDARTLKCNPDYPQRKVRHRALLDGKRVYMAVPKLADAKPFLLLDPEAIGEGNLWKATSIKGASKHGTPVALGDVACIDLIVTGCVAAARDGVRLGKGGGYSDLEYAVLREVGKVGVDTPAATTVHPLQVCGPGELPRDPQDLTLDWIVTPDRAIHVLDRPKRPRGILWEALSDEKIRSIPILSEWYGA